MKGNSFYVIGEIRGEECWAYAMSIPNSNNLVSLCRNKNIISVNACKTLKEAERIAEMWNNGNIEPFENV